MSETPELPPGVRLDPRKGPKGAQYVLITCAHCDRVFRVPLWEVRFNIKSGRPHRKYCSLECSTQAIILAHKRGS